MIHTPHSSTPIQTFHQPRTPQTPFFWGWGNPTKYGKTIFPSTALIFYQPNHLSVHDDVEATLKLVKSEGKGALDRGKLDTPGDDLWKMNWIALPECKSAKVW